jgi:hypothetical protein
MTGKRGSAYLPTTDPPLPCPPLKKSLPTLFEAKLAENLDVW